MAEEDNLKTIAQIVAWMEDDEEADHAALICFEDDGHINLHVLADLIFKAHNNELFELRKELERLKLELKNAKDEVEAVKESAQKSHERLMAVLSDPDIERFMATLSDPDIH